MKVQAPNSQNHVSNHDLATTIHQKAPQSKIWNKVYGWGKQFSTIKTNIFIQWFSIKKLLHKDGEEQVMA